jgi:NAD(P)-dependent dehydrogenase (short-subunit alcohol dehydrogenase family)
MSAQPTQKPVCVVVGVGPGNGAAFARRFVAEGYAVALLARSTGLTSRLAKELPVARAYAWDVGDPAAVELTFESIESDLGSVEWLTNTFGAFAAARGVIPAMKRRAAGTLTSSTSSTSSVRPLLAEAAPRRPHLLQPRRPSTVLPNPSPVRSGHRGSMSR